MTSELTLEFSPTDMTIEGEGLITKKSGCWIACFKKQGITAYGETINIATEKATRMLKTWCELHRSK